jgi:hypothetical protein
VLPVYLCGVITEVVCGEGTYVGMLQDNIMLRHGCSDLKVVHGDGVGWVVVYDESVSNDGGKRMPPQEWLDSSIRKREEVNTKQSRSRGVTGADGRMGLWEELRNAVGEG